MQLLLFLLAGKVFTTLIGIWFYKYLNTTYRLILLQVLIAMGAETYGYILSTTSKNNLWFLNFYWMVEFSLMTIIAMKLLKTKRVKKPILILSSVVSVIWLINIANTGLSYYATWGISAINIALVTVYFIVLFHTLFIQLPILRQADFWFSISALVFYGCQIPYYALFNYLYVHYPTLLNSFFDITIALDFIRYPLVGLSFYLYARQKKRETPELTSPIVDH